MEAFALAAKNFSIFSFFCAMAGLGRGRGRGEGVKRREGE